MPRGSPRTLVAVRLAPAGLTWLDETATTTSTDRSMVLRAALALARKHEAELKTILKTARETA